MRVRLATTADVEKIMATYAVAREFMRTHGNPTQWGSGFPPLAAIEADVAAGACNVVEHEGRVVGVFAFLPGPDPTYASIDGAWHHDGPYHVIHRVASDGSVRGVASACFRHCQAACDHLRIDTHADNLPMQGAVEKFGFERCGIIRIADGSPRIAFDWHR